MEIDALRVICPTCCAPKRERCHPLWSLVEPWNDPVYTHPHAARVKAAKKVQSAKKKRERPGARAILDDHKDTAAEAASYDA